MNTKSFNDILKDLDGAESTNHTAAIEELAKKLHTQGIASTMMEAREKAKSMVTTTKGVNKEFTQKKEQLTTYNDPRNNPNYNQYRATMVEEIRNRAINGRAPIKIQSEFQTPGFEKKNGNERLPRAVVQEKKKTQSVDLGEVFDFSKK